jgi:hypothetical protein
MFFDLEALQGERFQFFGSHLDPNTGNITYDEPAGDAWVTVRGMVPFIEERLAKRKKVIEHIYNPKTRAMERISFYPDLSPEEAKAENDDLWDYVITGLENFRDSKTKEPIACTRENKIALMKVPVFDRFIARCLQMLSESGIKDKEDLPKN